MASPPPLIAGVELGGTKTVVLIARGPTILRIARLPTTAAGPTLEAAVARLEAWSDRLGPFAALGIASFGPLGLDRTRRDFGFITTTPKPGWRQVDLVGRFGAAFDVPIGLDTDVAGAGVAEGLWGAGRGCEVVVYLTVGTGLGGGVVVGGVPVHGRVHPEIGHLRIRRAPGDTFPGVCPYHGDCIEGLCSGPAIAARAGAPAETLGADHPIWRRVADELAELVAMLMLTLSPHRILIGGGVGVGRRFLLPMIREAAAARLAGYVSGVTPAAMARMVRAPGLGERAGPLGAVALGLNAMPSRSAAAP